jgi:hypothetical protein
MASGEEQDRRDSNPAHAAVQQLPHAGTDVGLGQLQETRLYIELRAQLRNLPSQRLEFV